MHEGYHLVPEIAAPPRGTAGTTPSRSTPPLGRSRGKYWVCLNCQERNWLQVLGLQDHDGDVMSLSGQTSPFPRHVCPSPQQPMRARGMQTTGIGVAARGLLIRVQTGCLDCYLFSWRTCGSRSPIRLMIRSGMTSRFCGKSTSERGRCLNFEAGQTTQTPFMPRL